MKDNLCHVKWPWGIVNVIQSWPITKIYDMSITAIAIGKRCEKTSFVSSSPLAPLRFLS